MLSDFLQLSYWSFIISITKSKFNYGTIEPPKSSTQHPNPNEGSFPIKFINEENLNGKAVYSSQADPSTGILTPQYLNRGFLIPGY